MSIRYVLTTIQDEQIWAPIVACDYCDDQITGYGNVLWDPSEDRMITKPWFAHKGECNRMVEEKHSPTLLYWEELDRWLMHLTNNTVKPGHRVRHGALS